MRITIILLIFTLSLNAQVHLGPFVGAVTDSSSVFIVKTYTEQKVMIELFTRNDVNNSIFSSEEITDSSNYLYTKIYLTGLKPNTEYFYRAVVDGFPSKRWHSFQTFPKGENYSFSFGFGSCQQSSWGVWKPEIFPVIANDTIRFFIQIGDWTYPDTTEKKYGYKYNTKIELLERSYRSKYDYNYPFASEVLFKMPVVYVYDDHDFASNNSDGSDSAKQNTIWAYKTFFPHYQLENPDNGIWQSFTFGDVEFFVLDLRAQRNIDSLALDEKGRINPPPGHSILARYEITGVNQKEWFLNALKNSTAKWKVIVSSVVFNPAYAKVAEVDSLPGDSWWLPSDASDKWAGYPEDYNALINTIKGNNIKNVIVISGDSHSSYIDDGTNSLIPEISASNLEVNNSKVDQRLKKIGINIWNQGSYDGDGHTYGKVSFIYGNEEYALLEVIDEKGEVVISYRLDAE
jgi:alkaline phosphatase D